MLIRTEQDIIPFENAVKKCRRPVWLVSPDGEYYNLKNIQEFYLGIAKLLKDKHGEMEIFTSCFEDEKIMMDFYENHVRHAA